MSLNRKDILGAAFAIIICEAVGLIGGFATSSSVSTWYPTLEKPWFNPPGWVFAPVWTTLYAMMGLAAYLVWRIGWSHHRVRVAIAAFAVQLGLNLLWSFLFFGMQSPLAAMVEIYVLLAAILLTTILFFRVRPAAGWLMLPYVAWTAFAAVLNSAIVVLN